MTGRAEQGGGAGRCECGWHVEKDGWQHGAGGGGSGDSTRTDSKERKDEKKIGNAEGMEEAGEIEAHV